MATGSATTFVNGKIFTARDEEEFATAFTVEGGTFGWVGDAGEVDRAGAVDLGGRTVLPGFVDVHTHPPLVAMTLDAVPCTLPLVYDIPSMIEALKTHPNAGKGSSAWIEGWGYDESKLADLEQQLAAPLAGGGEKYVKRHHDRGKLTPRERIELLIDEDTPFLELCPLAGWGTDYTPGGSIVGGIGVVSLFGIAWLSYVSGKAFVETAIAALLFIPGDLIKAFVAMLAGRAVLAGYPLLPARS